VPYKGEMKFCWKAKSKPFKGNLKSFWFSLKSYVARKQVPMVHVMVF